MRIRLVVIDDEVLVRKGIVSSIDWSHYDIDIVGEATDGISAMELIRETKPHIVLTDIRMPHMDGLELTRVIHNELPETKILILSVLEDFQSVREALRLGVVDYVQKLLMTPDELLNAVLRIKESLITEASMTYTVLPEEQRTVLSGNEVWEWLQGSSSMSVERLLLGHTSFVVGQIHVNNKRKILRHPNVVIESDEWREVERWFRKSKHSIIKNALLDLESERLLWLLIGSEESSVPLNILANELNLLVNTCISKDLTISIGLSQSFSDIDKRETAKKQAQRSLQQRFYHGDGHIHMCIEGESESESETASALDFLDHSDLSNYLVQLNNTNGEQAQDAFDRLLPLEINKALSPIVVRDGIYHWISSLMLWLRVGGGYLEGTLSSHSPFEQASAIETYPELRQWCQRLHQVVREMLLTKYRTEIQKAIDYTHAYYMNPIRVKDVADAVNLSENYFSYLFSKETGKTYIQFLQETRVDRAKKMLRNSSENWFDITDKVGFESPKYFTKIFKKYTGMTPMHYGKESSSTNLKES